MTKINSKTDAPDNLSELFSLSPVLGKPIDVSFTAPDLSNQGGLLLLREQERETGFIKSLCSHINDQRCSWLIQQPCKMPVY